MKVQSAYLVIEADAAENTYAGDKLIHDHRDSRGGVTMAFQNYRLHPRLLRLPGCLNGINAAWPGRRSRVHVHVY
jgi:hypothetical protein